MITCIYSKEDVWIKKVVVWTNGFTLEMLTVSSRKGSRFQLM